MYHVDVCLVDRAHSTAPRLVRMGTARKMPVLHAVARAADINEIIKE